MINTKQKPNLLAAWGWIGRWTRAIRGVRLVAFSVAVLEFGGSTVPAITFYVATDGSDTNSGTMSEPFATLEKARDTLRQLKSAGSLTNGATVFVRGGIYFRTNTFTLDSRDSGLSANAPVIFRAYTNEHPVLVGGLPITNFVPWKNNIMMADVSTQGFSGIHFDQLFFDGRRQTLARYPNDDGIGTNSYSLVLAGSGTSQFTYKPGDIHSYANPAEVQVFIFSGANWGNDIVPISSIDTNTQTVVLKGGAAHTLQAGNRYFVRNALEDLDAAGEWYLDSTNRYLYFYPPSPFTDSTPVYAPALTNLATIAAGTANITLNGFTLEYCEGAAVKLTGSTNCLVVANTIVNSGNFVESGVIVSGGFTNGVIGNDISHVGRAGIVITGGTTRTLVPANNYADNNYIHNVGVFCKGIYGCGIDLEGVGNRASRNVICEGPRSGIYFWGQNLQIVSNVVYNVMLETDDGGALYTWNLDWLYSWGTVIANNYIHDARGYGYYDGTYYSAPCEASGIYLDFDTHGVNISNNIVARCSQSGLYINGGSENYARNNILYLNQPSGRGITCSGSYQIQGFTTNDSYWTSYYDDFVTGYNSVSQAIWKFPGFSVSPSNLSGSVTFSNSFCANIIVNSNAPQWACVLYFANPNAVQNTIESNLYYYTGGGYYDYVPVYTNGAIPTLAQWQGTGDDTHSLTNNPLLETNTWRLDPASPALTLGFRPIPVGGIGCYQDECRASWPVPPSEVVFGGPTSPGHLRVLGAVLYQ